MANELLYDKKFHTSEFEPSERLFRGFRSNEFDENTNKILPCNIRFPDMSFNWERFSRPEDIKKRANGRETDGCYAITVEASRYKNMATPCHDPNPEKDPKNYAHVIVRQLRPGENIMEEPPKRPELVKEEDGWSRAQKFDYRKNINSTLEILIKPTA